ncbi:MAG: 50S ribosomal protein L25 [Calditrichaeota bacterium]|nr:MAG: 50S ribosomal protein L25 [Calditrichota bacterium]
MSEAKLSAVIRTESGKKVAKALRRSDEIPAIYYIHGQESLALSIEKKNFLTSYKSDAQVITLDIKKGKKLPSIIRDVQWDPVTDEPLHVDFMGVKMDEKVTSTVPIQLVGEPIGVKEQGGILQFILRQVDIEALPMDIPESFKIDVSELNLHDSLNVSALEFENGEIITDDQSVVVSITAPKLVVEEDEEEAEETEEAAETEEETETDSEE